MMIDTTKTAKQKLKEAAAARRTEKAQQKQAAKIAARASQVTLNASNENSDMMGAPKDASMASESGTLHPRSVSGGANIAGINNDQS